jgi:D-alanine-D-alanine ligase-like ATP-grasp enzyme|tara:strand:- start:130 stop:315 length:186 start_codon:yes stop_codon:yes gene_type:complete
MQQRCTVAMLFGGQSAEQEVSIQSALNVHAALEATGIPTVKTLSFGRSNAVGYADALRELG